MRRSFFILGVATLASSCVSKEQGSEDIFYNDENNSENQEEQEECCEADSHSSSAKAGQTSPGERASPPNNPAVEGSGGALDVTALINSMRSQNNVDDPKTIKKTDATANQPAVIANHHKETVNQTVSAMTKKSDGKSETDKKFLKDGENPSIANTISKNAKKNSEDKSDRSSKEDFRDLRSAVLAIRESPNLNARIVGYLSSEDKVKVIKEGWGGWSKIGENQFVRSKYLSNGGSVTVGLGSDLYNVTIEAIYIRSRPSENGTIVGVLRKGDKIRGQSIRDGWIQVEKNRFVRKKYLEFVGH